MSPSAQSCIPTPHRCLEDHFLKTSVSNYLSQRLFLRKTDLRLLIPEVILEKTSKQNLGATLLTSLLEMSAPSLVAEGIMMASCMWFNTIVKSFIRADALSQLFESFGEVIILRTTESDNNC